MPSLDLSNLNVILSVLGLFIVVYGFLSVKIKQRWYLGEALPAVLIGIALGQVGSRWIDPTDWGEGGAELQHDVTLGLCRVVIGVQLVIVGFQLPARYQLQRWRPMALLLLAAMTIMWLCTTGCIMLALPGSHTFLAALVIASCVTCTDPILSQAIAKGPFADKYVRRPLREIISSEAGANDGFGFPFLMLATYLIRHAQDPDFFDGVSSDAGHTADETVHNPLRIRAVHEIGRLGGGVGVALQAWLVETWIYFILLAIVYGAVCGFVSMYATRFALRRRWIDGESYLLWPAGLGLFIVGTSGLIGVDDLLACFVAGNFMNWNNEYLAETELRHDEVNPCVDVLLNFGGFMYIGAVLPWHQWNDPDGTGLTYPTLIGLGFLVLIFRRIPAILALYRFMPEVCQDWKEALFMGYFGPIGIGAVFYVEHTRHLFPLPDDALTPEENHLARRMIPVVYWLVFFSIVVHGLSIPGLNIILKWRGVPPICDDSGGVELNLLSAHASLPKNSRRRKSLDDRRSSVIVQHNRFSRSGCFTPSAVTPVFFTDPYSGPVTASAISPLRSPLRPPSTPSPFLFPRARRRSRPPPLAKDTLESGPADRPTVAVTFAEPAPDAFGRKEKPSVSVDERRVGMGKRLPCLPDGSF